MGFKLVSAMLMVALALSGPLAPLAWAQEKAEGQMAPAREKGDGAWEFGAAVVNTVYVPGKAFLCATGAAAGILVLLVTFGSGYKEAGGVWREGCGGPWTITAADLKGTEAESPYMSDAPGFQKSDYQKTQ